jgi:biotin carboxyl carrier protein
MIMKKFLIKVNGNQYKVEVEEIRDQPAETNAVYKTGVNRSDLVSSHATPVQKLTIDKENAVSNGTLIITAPMPGIIFKVNVKADDQIKKGQVLLILETMKMENEIVAPTDGVIASVNVSEGASVNVGDMLLSLTL